MVRVALFVPVPFHDYRKPPDTWRHNFKLFLKPEQIERNTHLGRQ